MKWIKPENSRGAIDRAGDAIVVTNYDQMSEHVFREWIDAYKIVNNWRASHSYALHTAKMKLLRRARQVEREVLVAQRLKRFNSIQSKLDRFPGMKLSRMQDLGGCRAIFSRVDAVRVLLRKYQKESCSRIDNYLDEPKPDGYRGVHIVQQYESSSEQYSCFDGLRVEVQVRSRPQHFWATAVETVSTFTNQALKSNVGEDSWKRFFALMGTAIAVREECPPVPDTSTGSALADELQDLDGRLNVRHVLRGWTTAIEHIEAKNQSDTHFLMVLDSEKFSITVRGFKSLGPATAAYSEIEELNKTRPSVQSVLVKADSIADLRRAYPNYFLDTEDFMRIFEDEVTNRGVIKAHRKRSN